MLGSGEGRSVFFLSFSLSLSCLLPGRWNTSGKYRNGPFCDEEADPSGIRFDKAGGMYAAGRDAIHADDDLLGLAGSEWDVGGAGTRTTPGGNTGATPAACPFRGGCWPEGAGGHLV